ncbi:MAG: hypothetical protein M3239_06710 [Thermoproteota archaeon]|nr:hypothetical protein [Thermoproteota archaeon]
MSTSSTNTASVAVYGLSTEGYRIASSIAVNGSKVSLIDESVRMAILLKPDIARTYPNVSSLMEDEPLLDLQPIDIAISNASYVYFAPRIRKVGQDVKSDVMTKFKDAIKALKRGASLIYMLPTGVGGNNENIALIEHMTGMTVEKDVSYYYFPMSPIAASSETLIGSFKSKHDNHISKMLYDPDTRRKLNFVDINSAELVHVIKTLSHYSGMASILEICKKATDSNIRSELMHSTFADLYIDDVTSGLYDLRIIGSSLDGTGPLMYLVNGSIKSIEGYLKFLIDQVRATLKKRDLKASRTKVAIAWTLDPHEMRGDRVELLSSFETKIKDYISDVDRQQGSTFDLYHTDKTTIVIACSKTDFEKIMSKNMANQEFIVMKANPLCEIVQE